MSQKYVLIRHTDCKPPAGTKSTAYTGQRSVLFKKKKEDRLSHRVKQWWQTSLARLLDTQHASGSAKYTSSPLSILAVARRPLPFPGLTKRSSFGAIVGYFFLHVNRAVFTSANRHDASWRHKHVHTSMNGRSSHLLWAFPASDYNTENFCLCMKNKIETFLKNLCQTSFLFWIISLQVFLLKSYHWNKVRSETYRICSIILDIQ